MAETRFGQPMIEKVRDDFFDGLLTMVRAPFVARIIAAAGTEDQYFHLRDRTRPARPRLWQAMEHPRDQVSRDQTLPKMYLLIISSKSMADSVSMITSPSARGSSEPP